MANITPIKPDPASPPSPALREQKIKANECLLAYFDGGKGLYDAGWSDERVSTESGMPLSWVMKRREEDYGPLKVPSEIGEIQTETRDLASAIGKLQAKLDAVIKRNGWAN